MKSAKNIGRTAGLISLPRGFLAPAMNFWLLAPATAFNSLHAAAGKAAEVRAGLLVSFLFAALGIAFVVVVYPLFRRYSERLALAFLLASIIGVVTMALEDFAVVRLLTLSEGFATAGMAAPIFEAMNGSARATWRWTHYANLFVGQLSALLFATILFRYRLIPRLLSGLAIATIVVAVVGLALALLGYTFQMWTLTPMGLVQLALLVWMLRRGFAERPLPTATA